MICARSIFLLGCVLIVLGLDFYFLYDDGRSSGRRTVATNRPWAFHCRRHAPVSIPQPPIRRRIVFLSKPERTAVAAANSMETVPGKTLLPQPPP